MVFTGRYYVRTGFRTVNTLFRHFAGSLTSESAVEGALARTCMASQQSWKFDMKTKPPASNVEWEAWAKRDPLFAIATVPDREKEGKQPWREQDFFKLGESDWEDFHEAWTRYGLDPQSCLEIGCGAGRITRQLARSFRQVDAVDISEEMLAYALENVPDKHVSFHRCTGADLPIDDSSVANVFSCHVFQHFDDLAVAENYFLEIHRVLVEGGSLMVHAPIFCWPMAFERFERMRQVHKRWQDWKASVNRTLIAAGMFRPLMRRLEYPLEWFYRQLPKLGFENVVVQIIAPKSSGDPHPFVLARKMNWRLRNSAPTLTEPQPGQAWV